ncbi:MAG: LCP family protein [Hyphomicrobiales bacterium]
MRVPWKRWWVNRQVGGTAAILCLALGSVYAGLATYQAVDQYIFPGNELQIGKLPAFVPGTNVGVNVSLPGVSAGKEKPWTREEQLNILVMGIDRRPGYGDDEPARSDTLFVTSIDKRTGRVQMLAIPRDLWAEVPYGGEPDNWAPAKINAAFSYGIYFHYPGGGPAAAIAAVEHNYHIDIHHYVVIDWEGFVRLIDAIGGIDITVPEAISDFSTDVLDSFENRTVQAGPQHMNGTQALGYSRVRVDGDIKRIERQQLVIRAVANQALSLGLIAKLPELWDSYHDAIRTDVDNALVPGLALLANQMDLEHIETFSLAPALYSGISEDGQLILLPNFDEVYKIIDTFLEDPRTRDEAPVIGVEYPAGMESEAERVKAHIAAYGVPPESIELVQGGRGEPGIYDLTDKTYTSAKIADLLELPSEKPDDERPAGVDVLVRIAGPVQLKTP